MIVDNKLIVHFRHSPFENKKKKRRDRWTECSINTFIPSSEGHVETPIVHTRAAAHAGDPFCRPTGIYLSFKKAVTKETIPKKRDRTLLWDEFKKHHRIVPPPKPTT